MQICKNCHSENPDGTVKCIQCNMEGKFIYLNADGTQQETIFVESHPVHCHNCGTEATGDGSKCAQCNFPLPQPKTKPAPESKLETPLKQMPVTRKRNYSSFQPWEISNQKTG